MRRLISVRLILTDHILRGFILVDREIILVSRGLIFAVAQCTMYYL